MELSLKFTTLVIAVLFTGLSAGLCFTWTNAVTLGIGRLDDLGYLQSFQQMNRTILNPMFFVVFFGPFFLNLLNIYFFKSNSQTMVYLLILATALYFFGVILITIFGNVPLNELLDKTNLVSANDRELKSLREAFEMKWNRLHLIRTITSILSFLLLLISLIQNSKTTII